MRRGITIIRWASLLFILAATAAYADEQVRQTQEELRKRNLYFGDVDGQFSSDLANSLKRYQQRKGFSATGTINEETASSLGVQLPAPATVAQAELPDVPILRSDLARQLPETERIALEKQAEENPDRPPISSPPAEPPGTGQNITPERVRTLVENYLRDGETSDVKAQTRYFSYPVDYFVHGKKGPDFVEKDVQSYINRWPDRRYALLRPVTFLASEKEGETTVEFDIAYILHRAKDSAKGQTRNTWTIRAEGDDLKIAAIHEQRIRPAPPPVAE